MKVIVKSINERNERDEFFYENLGSLTLRRRKTNISLTVGSDYCVTMDPDTTIDIRNRYRVSYDPREEEKDIYHGACANLFTPYESIFDLIADSMYDDCDSEWLEIRIDEPNKRVVIERQTNNIIRTTHAREFADCLVTNEDMFRDTEGQVLITDDIQTRRAKSIQIEIDKLKIKKEVI